MDLKYRLPAVQLGSATLEVPIIMGGMAIRLGGPRTAAAVSACGGLGLVGGSGMEEEEAIAANLLMKNLAGDKPTGFNVMRAMRRFPELVQALLADGLGVLAVGAGFSRDFFGWAREAGTPVITIVSSVKAAQASEHCGAAGVALEGPSGGHQGTDVNVFEFLEEVANAVSIPVFAAGGIATGEDIYRAEQFGAKGVQIGTRFALSPEILTDGVSREWQNLLLGAKEEDMVLVPSPAGMPFQTYRTELVVEYLRNGVYHQPGGPSCPQNCLRKCGYRDSGFTECFCIYQALQNGRDGDIAHGVVTAGPKVGEMMFLQRVQDTFTSLAIGYDNAATKAENAA